MIANVEGRAVIHAVFKDQESLVAMLKDLKAEELSKHACAVYLAPIVPPICFRKWPREKRFYDNKEGRT
jgi:hypothetical protein